MPGNSLPPIFAEALKDERFILADVGARGGLHERWRSLDNCLEVLAFEPDPEEAARLEQTSPANVRVVKAALDQRPAKRRLHVTRSPGCSSLLRPNAALLKRFPDSERFDVIADVDLDAECFDEALHVRGIPRVDFLKLDVQGSELSILEGASAALRDCVIGVEVEVEFAEMYEGQPLFGDVHAYMSASGFVLHDLRPFHWKYATGYRYGGPKGRIIFGEALYLKGPEAILCENESLLPNSARDRLLRGLLICWAYGYSDLALELIQCAREMQAVLSPEEYGAWSKPFRIRRGLRHSLPRFPGRWYLAVLFRAIADVFASPSEFGWSGEELGNSKR